jgi:hypothetical protein
MERRVLSPATPWSTGFTPTSKTPGSCATSCPARGLGHSYAGITSTQDAAGLAHDPHNGYCS